MAYRRSSRTAWRERSLIGSLKLAELEVIS